VPTGRQKWNTIFHLNDEEWKNIYKCCFLTTKDSELLLLQFRTNHNILPTKTFLFKIGISSNKYCTFCESNLETLEHIFWECPKTSNLIQDFRNLLYIKNINLNMNKNIFIFGFWNIKQKYNAQNYILLLMKFYLHQTKCLDGMLSLQNFITC